MTAFESTVSTLRAQLRQELLAEVLANIDAKRQPNATVRVNSDSVTAKPPRRKWGTGKPAVVAALGKRPQSTTDIARRVGWLRHSASVTLGNLVAEGRAKRVGRGLYVRAGRS